MIDESGKLPAKAVAQDTPIVDEVRRLGFMPKQLTVPDDFDRMGKEAIARLFNETSQDP